MKGSQKEIKDVPNVKSNIAFGKNIKNSLEIDGIDKQIRLIQGIMKRFKARKIYLLVRNKIRVRMCLYFQENQTYFSFSEEVETITNNKYATVPNDRYFVLNDDRQNENDSRKFGLIKESQIRGVVTFKIYPLSQFGFIDSEQQRYYFFYFSNFKF